MYAFRGQSNADWALEPTLLRSLRRMELSEAEALVVEQRCLAEFRSQAHLHISPNTLSTTPDTLSWWTLMQHHGAPTRLLDWCGSIYVAAYFAVTGSLELPGSIWLAHIHTVDSAMHESYGEGDFPSTQKEIEKVFLQPDPPPAIRFAGRLSNSDRMAAQQGFFSACRSVLGHPGEILAECTAKSDDKLVFRKIVIPSRLKNVFLRKLRSMNITANSLFPGLDGLARSVGELVQILGKGAL